VLGSVFKVHYGFRRSQDIIAITLLSFMVLYYLVCGRNKIFEQALPAPEEILEKEHHHHIHEGKETKVLEPLLSHNMGPSNNDDSGQYDKLINRSLSSTGSRHSTVGRVSVGSKVHFFNQYGHQNFAPSHSHADGEQGLPGSSSGAVVVHGTSIQ
jgi:hypothetical protein